VAAALLDFITVHTLHQKHLWIQAWTVDTMSRVDALAQLGVNEITTNSLPILSALQNNRV
jgi:glycerophosphoryl diester phosphodiesterase